MMIAKRDITQKARKASGKFASSPSKPPMIATAIINPLIENRKRASLMAGTPKGLTGNSNP